MQQAPVGCDEDSIEENLAACIGEIEEMEFEVFEGAICPECQQAMDVYVSAVLEFQSKQSAASTACPTTKPIPDLRACSDAIATSKAAIDYAVSAKATLLHCILVHPGCSASGLSSGGEWALPGVSPQSDGYA